MMLMKPPPGEVNAKAITTARGTLDTFLETSCRACAECLRVWVGQRWGAGRTLHRTIPLEGDNIKRKHMFIPLNLSGSIATDV
jgi:hypothetical protein